MDINESELSGLMAETGTALGEVTGALIMEVMTKYGPFWGYYKQDHDRGVGLIYTDSNAEMIFQCKEGGILIDVGAHLGRYTIPMSMKGRVFAFEPDPYNFKRLNENIANYPNISPHCKAVSNKSGKVKLYRSIRTLENSIINPHEDHPKDEIEVDAVSIDDFLSGVHLEKPVTAIKIDVEGAELLVLEGALNTIKEYMPIISLEVHANLDKQMTIDMVMSLKEMGYKLYGQFGQLLCYRE